MTFAIHTLVFPWATTRPLMQCNTVIIAMQYGTKQLKFHMPTLYSVTWGLWCAKMWSYCYINRIERSSSWWSLQGCTRMYQNDNFQCSQFHFSDTKFSIKNLDTPCMRLFVSSRYDQWFTFTVAILYVISCPNSPCYKATHPTVQSDHQRFLSL